MERIERVNSSYDLEFDYYRKNLPALGELDDTEESYDLYEKIFESRKTFTILGLDSYIILNKKSLNKIAKMIKAHPQEYVLFTQHQIIDEEKFDELLEKEKDQLNPILVPEAEQESKNDLKENYKNEEDLDEKVSEETFKICLWLYLFLILCSICNFIFLIYIAASKKIGFEFFTCYTFFYLDFFYLLEFMDFLNVKCMIFLDVL